MKLTHFLVAGAMATTVMSTSVFAADTVSQAQAQPSSTVSDAQRKDIEKIIHEYLVANPEVLLEASQALQKKEQQNMQQQAQSAIKDNASSLFEGKLTTVGNAKGNVTVVEFFDYQCIHCKKMSPIINGIIKKDSDVRVIYKEFPIFGKSSEMASRAALAAGMQGKYLPMHEALLKIEKRLDEKTIMDAAKSLGLDMKKLSTDMQSKEISDILEANRALADKLHLMGTPAFVIAATPAGQYKEGSESSFVPGAASEESLQEMIKKAAGN